MSVVTLELDEGHLATVEGLARNLGLPRDELVGEAIANWLALQAWHIDQIKAGIADADAGRFVTEEELEAIVRGDDAPR